MKDSGEKSQERDAGGCVRGRIRVGPSGKRPQTDQGRVTDQDTQVAQTEGPKLKLRAQTTLVVGCRRRRKAGLRPRERTSKLKYMVGRMV
jgi:hypothetical protein